MRVRKLEIRNPHRAEEDCYLLGCVVHGPSNHHMNRWPVLMRLNGVVERTCPHGVGHPDPDHLAWVRRAWGAHVADDDAVHGCDGCCGVPGGKATTAAVPTATSEPWPAIPEKWRIGVTHHNTPQPRPSEQEQLGIYLVWRMCDNCANPAWTAERVGERARPAITCSWCKAGLARVRRV